MKKGPLGLAARRLSEPGNVGPELRVVPHLGLWVVRAKGLGFRALGSFKEHPVLELYSTLKADPLIEP